MTQTLVRELVISAAFAHEDAPWW